MAKIRKPKWKTQTAVRVGTAVHEAASRNRADLEPRLEAGALDGLAADVETLRNTAAGVTSSRAESRSSTLGQAAALVRGTDIVVAVRSAVRRVYPQDKALQRDVGVGMKVNARSAASVAGALRTVLDGAAKHPAELRGAAVLESDLALATEALAGLGAAGRKQAAKQLSSREATARRRDAQLRVEATVARIVAAAEVAYFDRPALSVLFTSMMPGRAERPAASEVSDPAPSPGSPA